ncbi:MAG: hypothetical protein GY810_10270 [Aureispira sp.]|nr:hypothetical protein [Aureispira sp.]
MRYFSTLFFLGFWCCQLHAQSALDSNLHVRDFHFEHNVYDESKGTKGIVFSYEYFYPSTSNFLVSIPNDVRLYKNSEEIYIDSSSFVTLRANAWAKAKIFIPYRNINLEGGLHNNLSFAYNANKEIKWFSNISFNQPNRCLVEIGLQEGSVKRKLKQWDQGANPIEWLPDPYAVFYTNKGTTPFYRMPLIKNNYTIDTQKLKFYILEGEILHWAFYDEDGVVDQPLGTLTLFEASGDFEKLFRGQMFGDIKGLTFSFSKKLQVRQPISIFVDSSSIHKDRKGVGIRIEYNLARAYKGEQAIPQLIFKDKAGSIIDVPYIYSLNETAILGQKVKLDIEGQWDYFIPFYAWNSNIYKIECPLNIENKATTQSAPRLLYNPITFDKYVSYTLFEVQENKKYMGASGLYVQLGYQVTDINRYSDLEILFSSGYDASTPFHIYQLHKNGSAEIVKTKPLRIKKPKAIDTLTFFVPYQTLKTDQIHAELSMIPDMKIKLFSGASSKIEKPKNSNDAVIQLAKTLPVFKEGDYGQVFSLKSTTPKFFLSYSRLNIKVQRNGKDYKNYIIHTNNTESDSFLLVKDTGTIDLVLPFRNLIGKDRIDFSCFISDLKGYPMSDTIKESWQANGDLHNKKVSIGLEKMVYAKGAIPESLKGKNTKWKYQIFLGSQRKMTKTLVKNFKGKDIRNKFRRTFKIHREDLIQIKLVHSKTEREVMLWSGDLGKFELHKNKSIILDKSPVKKAIIKVKVIN